MDAALIDSDILSEVLKQRNPVVLGHAGQYLQQHGQFAISAVTRFELLRGFTELGATTQLARFATFCQHTLVLPLTDSVFDRAADLWAVARRGGYPHADADLLIAATALEHSRVLVTGNGPHFTWIAGLTLADWRQP
jgi:tRNA(fMet)-specific endonuclease VapC